MVTRGYISQLSFMLYMALPDKSGNQRSSVCFGCIDYSKIAGGCECCQLNCDLLPNCKEAASSITYHSLSEDEEDHWALDV